MSRPGASRPGLPADGMRRWPRWLPGVLLLSGVLGLGGCGDAGSSASDCVPGSTRSCDVPCPLTGEVARAACSAVDGQPVWEACYCVPAGEGEGEGASEGEGEGASEGEGEGEGASEGEGEGASEGEGEPEALTVARLEPGQGPVAGGTFVEVYGTGFARPLTAYLGERLVSEVVVRDAGHLTLRTPPADAPGPADLQLQDRNGVIVVGEAFHYHGELMLSGAVPDHAPAAGGTALLVSGAGFVPGVLLTVGGRLAVGTTLLDESTLLAYSPRGEPGPAELRVLLPDGRQAVLPAGLTYQPELELQRVDPASGPVTGGTELTLEGRGFTQGVTVRIGDLQAELLGRAEDGRALRVRTPEHPPGSQPVTVNLGPASATLARGFTYFDPSPGALALLAVTPDHGATAGGELVTLVGAGFDGQTRALFGDTPAACVLQSPNLLQCRAPAHVEGTVDVAVGAGGQGAVQRLADAYRFWPPLEVRRVQPGQGPAAGGTAVTLSGVGFVPGASVRLGVLPLEQVEVLNDTTIQGLAPPGSAGPAEVVVTQQGRQAVLEAGYSYTDELRLLSLRPAQGSVAGNSQLTVSGTGFLPGMQLLFGATPATEVEVLDGALLRLRTPPGVAGPVDVTLRAPDGSVRTLPGGFEYFDPTTLFGGAWGGPVQGTLNVSVRNALSMDVPLPGAFVMLWSDRATRYQGTTDAQGLITFSGADLQGQQMITAALEGFESTSVVRCDAENVTIALQPKPDPQQGEPAPGLPPARISGVVWGMDKYIPRPTSPGVSKVAYVTTTCAGPSSCGAQYRPLPGPGGVLRQDGPYAIDARLGDLAVIAVAGHYSSVTRHFTPLRMGVRRFVFGISGEETTDVDIQLDLLLDERAHYLFDQPVSGVLPMPGPNVMVVRPYLDLETEGVYDLSYPDEELGDHVPFLVYSGPIVAALDAPGFPPLTGSLTGLSYTFVSGTYTHYPGATGEYAPESVNTTHEVVSLEEPVAITPFVGVPDLSSPSPTTYTLAGRTIAWTLSGGSTLPNAQWIIIQQPSFPAPIPIWSLFVDGTTRAVELPPLDDISALPLDVMLEVIVISGYLDGFNFNQFEYGDYDMNLWRSFGAHYGGFYYP